MFTIKQFCCLLWIGIATWICGCTGNYDKHPKDVRGKIVLFTKNDINRMDTIAKYFPDTEIELKFGESTSGAMTSQTYPFHMGTLYWIGGISHYAPNDSDDCLLAGVSNTIINPQQISWTCYSHSDSCFVSLVDGEHPCGSTAWILKRVGKKGDFNLTHSAANGDVYKLEFR